MEIGILLQSPGIGIHAVRLGDHLRHVEVPERIVLEGLHGVPARVYLIGSRARGTAGRYSDIDIAILPERPLPVGTLAAIRETSEDSDILYTADIVNLEEVSGEFRERAIKEGCSMERLEERLAIARRVLKTLAELCALPSASAVERDAAIQRFAYSFEAAWKAAQLYLKDREGVDVASPKAVIRASMTSGLLDESSARRALVPIHVNYGT